MAARGLARLCARTFSSSSRLFSRGPSSIVTTLKINRSDEVATIPTFRVMDTAGKIVSETDFPKDIADGTIVQWYKHMVTLNQMDNILYDSQRQGRISFYMTNFGEEATHIGSAAAITPDDIVYAQYREAGVLLYRGFTLADFMNQCYSNHLDLGKGRQMPVHYGSNQLNFHTVSSPLATQVPQASGAAYAIKQRKEDRCVMCYFGDGAASRNNGYAISTPTKEQYRGDGIASRAVGYGMDWIRVDGNDIFAVFTATRAARKSAIENNRPVLIEAMTYRLGHHSTSDDSLKYRRTEEIAEHAVDTPITRLGAYLTQRGLWSAEQEKELQEGARAEVRKEFALAEKRLKPSISEMFKDVYDEMPQHLHEQEAKMKEHIAKYPAAYKTNLYAN